MEREYMTDEEFSATAKKIQEKTEYYKSIGVCVIDGFSAAVSYDRCSKQYIYMELWPFLSFPQPLTKEQAKFLKEELKKLRKAKGYQ